MIDQETKGLAGDNNSNKKPTLVMVGVVEPTHIVVQAGEIQLTEVVFKVKAIPAKESKI